ncbi:glycosyltransferase [Rosenbergiella australiborealis]|uniref:Lipopolysaccharide 1,3-galactosyltransferase n=1 Tax=Rosenbergiella australiborealis TaxID=1544696 RepID=A0ABS5T6P9_9GAMM|nr:glycosyltransferase [Rosenbergiella australiborealis]MBT0727413.1 lipopolysaccharide 1,3-galactosyltransferase [Rosenbergiella australiborealis]
MTAEKNLPAMSLLACEKSIKKQTVINPCAVSERAVQLHVGWGADGDFLLGCQISMASVITNNPEVCCHFHLFSNDISQLDQQKLFHLAQQYALVITLYTLDNDYFAQLPTNRLWSAAIYYRFIMAQVLAQSADRMLYLDADVICQGSITELLELDLSSTVAAVVPERDATWWAHQAKVLGCKALAQGYFNSGVMLLNLESWRREGILEQVLMLAANPEIQGKLTFYDQDLLNLALIDKKIFLNSAYNTQYSLNYELNEVKRKRFTSQCIFIHFIGPTKPWHLWAQYASAEAFQKAKADSPWNSEPLQQPTSTYQYRYCYKHLTKQKKRLKGYGYFLRYLLRKLLSLR